MTEAIGSSVKTIEVEAEKILESAKNKANEILLKAREESERIVSAELSLDEIKNQCSKIIDTANKEANELVEVSKKKAQEIKTTIKKFNG